MLSLFLTLTLGNNDIFVQLDPDLPGCSGEKGFPDISGLDTVNFLFREKIILPVNWGPTVSRILKINSSAFIPTWYPVMGGLFTIV